MVEVLATQSLVNAAELRELTATVFKTCLVPCAEPWRRQIGSITKQRAPSRTGEGSRTALSTIRERVGGVLALFGGDEGLAPEHVATVKTYWEGNVVKSSPVQLAAHVRHCRAKPCRKIEGKEGWTRVVFCLDPATLLLEPALEAALLLQKGIRKCGSAPRGPREKHRKQSVLPAVWGVVEGEGRGGAASVIAWLISCAGLCWNRRWRALFS